MSENGRAVDFEFVGEAFFSSHTLEQLFIEDMRFIHQTPGTICF